MIVSGLLDSRNLRLAGLATTLLLLPPASLSAQTCGDTAPAYPTPQFLGPVELWPDNFRPGKPGQPLPVGRDSTQYVSQSYPSWRSGHELFWSIATVDTYVFVGYSVGISVWDIAGTRAEDPVQINFRDGIEGHWLHHPPPGESDGVVQDVAAIADPNNSDNIIVAAAATQEVGATIWNFSRTTRQMTPVYQKTSREAFDVELMNINGNVYALFGSTAGSFILDASGAALLGGCLDSACPSSIDRGRIGSAGGARFISGMVKGGKLYAMTTYGGLAGGTPQGELWVIDDPMVPGAATRLFQAPVRDTHAGTIIKKGGQHYLAVVESRTVKIYPFDDCMDANGCSALPSPVFTDALRPQNWDANFLTYSESNGDPYLYYGCSNCLYTSGAAIERLYDLKNLGGSNLITEITASGGTYSDDLLPNTPCAVNHSGIGYWSHQYAYNRYGLRNFNPRRGVFNGLYFYRVTYATFDVHVRTASSTNPETHTSVVTPPPHWLGEPINFAATSDNCPGAELWNFATDPYAPGVDGTGAGDATATLNWALCGSDDCPSVVTEVWATKDACVGAADLEVHGASVTLADPRPRIREISVIPNGNPVDTYPLCSVLTFTADVDGKTPFTYQWTARNRNGVALASAVGPTFVWNTLGVPILLPEVFGDGFESGDVSRWNVGAVADPLAGAPTPAESVAEDGGEAPFFIEVLVTNPNVQRDAEVKQITLTELGPLAFGSPEITVTNLGDGEYRFVANTQNATGWRWEFEDPAFGTPGACRVLTAARCSVIAFGANDNDVTYQWEAPNSNGPYGVAVQAENCASSPISSAAGFTVNVTGISTGVPPSVTSFKVNPTAWDPGNICDPDSPINSTYFCHANDEVPFLIVHAGATHLQFDWNRDGVYEQEVSVATTITQEWTEIGPLPGKPRVRARNGSQLSTPVDLVKNMTILP